MVLKTGFELLIGLRYKLRMMGVPLDGPAYVKVDNMSVVKNSSMPESTLKKKSNVLLIISQGLAQLQVLEE